jgi:hypothetical protein
VKNLDYQHYLEQYLKNTDEALTKMGIPKQELWKFSEYGLDVKRSVLRAIDNFFVQNIRSGGPFSAQARNELKKLDGLNKSAKKIYRYIYERFRYSNVQTSWCWF